MEVEQSLLHERVIMRTSPNAFKTVEFRVETSDNIGSLEEALNDGWKIAERDLCGDRVVYILIKEKND